MARSKRRGRRQRKTTLPLAIIGGMLPVAAGVWARRSSGTEMANYLQAGFTGVTPGTGAWNIANLRMGLFPVMAGFMVHAIAGKLGVNRALGRARLPLIRV